MSLEQYQKAVNALDKEIADLEKKKAAEDKKASNAHKKASSVNISKTASLATIKSKMSQIERYEAEARKSEAASASLGKKIADKQKKRNEAYLKLQKEEKSEKKKQDKALKDMKTLFEKRIAEHECSNVRVIESLVNVESENEETEYDVFVSHAWEDKESFVDEFVQALVNKGAKVWYDKSKIKWGDSMRAKIDDGLRKSKFGVVVLSPDYIAPNKYWTKAELDGLFQLESINGKMLLPIWHNLTKKQVMEYSPIIAGRLAMNTASMTADEIANELIDMLLPENKSEAQQ